VTRSRRTCTFNRLVEQWRWRALAEDGAEGVMLPGGEGGLRKPYLMPSDAEVERFTSGLLAVGLAEIEGLAPAAGVG
jgi:hypothetical protein